MARFIAVADDADQGNSIPVLRRGRTLDAPEALQCGLVSRVVAPERLHAEAMAVVRRIASLSAPAVQAIKRSVREGLELPLGAALALERQLFHQSFAWPDRAEGMQAFVERRPAVFTH